jgi:Salmonella virulence plasmid 65kDa B protein
MMFRAFTSYITSAAIILAPIPSYGAPKSPNVAQSGSAVASRPTGASSAILNQVNTDGGTLASINTFLPNLFFGLPKVDIPILLPALRSALNVPLNPRFVLGQRGALGLGWDIPVPKISRIKRRGVDYSAKGFVLASSEGATDLVEIETDKFKLVSDSYQISISRLENGSFVLLNGDGTKSWFGITQNSLLHDVNSDRVFSWMIDRTQDRNGNELIFEYENLNGVPYLSSIGYGSREGQSPIFSVKLSYVEDDVSPISFELGFAVKNVRLLDQISITTLGRDIRKYKFNYLKKPTLGAYVLDSIVESGPKEKESRSYNIEYEFSAPFGKTASWSGGPSYSGTPWREQLDQCVTGNFGGHGRADLACYMESSGNWQVASSAGEGWKTSLWKEGAAPETRRIRWVGGMPPPRIKPVSDFCLTADFEGKGRTGIACYTGSVGKWQVALSTGSGWRTSFWERGPTPPTPVASASDFGTPIRNSCFSGDFEGKGRAIIACFTSAGRWQVALSTGSGWSTSVWEGGPSPAGPIGNSCVSGDFDGRGRTGIACYTANDTWQVALSSGSGWSTSLWKGGPSPKSLAGNSCVIGSFNGDSKTGIACYTGSAGKWQVALSTGSGWSTSFWEGGPAPSFPIGKFCEVGSFNGDSKTGIACYTGSAGKWQVALSTGSGWSTSFWEGGPAPSFPIGDQCVSGDFNGHGKTSFACHSKDPGVFTMWLADASVSAGLIRISFPTGVIVRYLYQWLDTVTHTFLPNAQPVLKSMSVAPGGCRKKQP